MNILLIGDVVSSQGCDFVRKTLPALRRLKGIDFCIANGENSAAGNGITKASALHLFDSGVDFITTGNHVFRQNDIYEFLDSRDDILRPANLHHSVPGKGTAIADMGSVQIGIINLMGNAYMDGTDNVFDCVDRELPKISECKIKIVDFHAEATGEKRALGYYLDGRVSIVGGTHTHVQTADEQILPGGTGYITDLGMTGPAQSVLGVDKDIIIEKLRTNLPVRFTTANGDCMMCGCIFEVDKSTGKTINTERICIE